MPSSDSRQQRQHSLTQPPQRHPFHQPSYPPILFGPLIHAIDRRALDEWHLPSLRASMRSSESFHSWSEILMGINRLTAALKGQTPRTEIDQANSDFHDSHNEGSHDSPVLSAQGRGYAQRRTQRRTFYYRPPLPPDLRMKVERTLMAVEAEAVQLGKDIEMNHFRVKRGDPRGKEEQVLGDMKERCARSWAMAIRECVRDVELLHTGLEGKTLKEEEDRLARRKGRGPRLAYKEGGKL